MMDVTDEELKAISHELESESPEAILRWALRTFGPDVALATGRIDSLKIYSKRYSLPQIKIYSKK
jgi:3'-phosphoadenosine 5'-phosphosulfate sulfotransferase (PAPS reductase)/FAD synthetase